MKKITIKGLSSSHNDSVGRVERVDGEVGEPGEPVGLPVVVRSGVWEEGMVGVVRCDTLVVFGPLVWPVEDLLVDVLLVLRRRLGIVRRPPYATAQLPSAAGCYTAQ